MAVNKPPLAYYAERGVSGFAAELVREALLRSGLKSTISMDSIARGFAVTAREANTGMFPLSRVPSREDDFKWVGPIISVTVSLYARRESGISPTTLEAARFVRSIAVMDGYASEGHLRDLGFKNLVSHRSPAQCADSLRFGRVDLWLVSDMAMPALAQQAGVNPKEFRKVLTVVEFPTYIGLSRTTSDNVVDSLQAALEAVRGDGTYDRLRERWFPKGKGKPGNAGSPIIFTPAELRWMEENAVVKAGVVGDLPPFQFRDEEGRHTGIVEDYLDYIRTRTGLDIDTGAPMPWTDALQGARAGTLDLLPGAVHTPERDSYLLFTEPFIVIPSVIITRQEAPFLIGLDDLRGWTVAVARNYYTQERLRADYPGIRLHLESNVMDALEAVSLGRADAYVGDLASATYYIRHQGLTNLKIAGRTEYESDAISFAVRRDLPELLGIIEKVLASMTQEQRDAIYDKWVALPYGADRSLRRFWMWAAPVALVAAVAMGMMLFWTRRLKREIRERTKAEERLVKSERRYRDLFENAQVGIMLSRFADGRLIAANRRMAELMGFDDTATLMEEETGLALFSNSADRSAIRIELERSGRFLNRQCSYVRSDGSKVWLNCSGLLDEDSGLLTSVAQNVTARRSAELALSAGESMMRSLVNSIPFFVCYLGPDRRYKLINSTGAEDLGISADGAVGMHVSELNPPDVWALFKPYEDQALSGVSVVADIQTDHIRQGGSYRVFFSPDKNPLGHVRGVAVCILDVTDQKRVESALRSSEERYRSVVERSHDGIVIVSAEGKLLFGNSRAEDMFGYTLDEVRGKGVRRFFPDEEWPRVRAMLGSMEEKTYEAVMLHRDGRPIHVENSRTVISYEGQRAALILIRDVSERKRAEKKLRHSEERLLTALDSTEFGLWEYVVETDALELPPKVFCEKYGHLPSALPKKLAQVSELIHPEDLPQALKVSHAYMEQGVEKLVYEFRVKDASEGWRWVAVHGRALERGSGGKPRRLLGLVHDITDRKHTEERLRELATLDGLTGLYNRRYFMEMAERELHRARRYRAPLSLLMLDVDHFKVINDTFGHSVGDKVLVALAELGLEGIRTVDMFGRVGGEEFAILLPETATERAVEVAERLRAAYEGHACDGGKKGEVRFTVSFGVAEARAEDSMDSLLRRSDEAMYTAKNNGRNRVETA